jgi:hypothetical protein
LRLLLAINNRPPRGSTFIMEFEEKLSKPN